MGLQFRIVYKRGQENRVADALSRRLDHHASESVILAAVSVVKLVWLEEVVQGYITDEHTQKLITALALGKEIPHFTLRDGLVRFKQRVWLGTNVELQTKVITALHASALGGHSGFPVTYRRVKALFAWPAMKSAIHQFVTQCIVCQQAKPERVKYPGLLQPLQLAAHSWQVVSMDFIEDLPKYGTQSCILVVVDTFSKYAHFIPLSHPFTALTVATAFMNNVYKLHGLPQAIVSDRDRVFTSHFWQELFKLTNTQLRMTSAYHPQFDGQTKRVNQYLETYLRCFVHACPK